MFHTVCPKSTAKIRVSVDSPPEPGPNGTPFWEELGFQLLGELVPGLSPSHVVRQGILSRWALE